MSVPPKERQPWPMKWVVLAIVVVIIPYTWITLHFRKPERPFEPYQDIKDRANVLRLLAAGFQRITVTAERPADAKTFSGAPVLPAPGGLPAELRATLIEPPLLPLDIERVSVPATASAGQTYTIQFTCDVPDNKQQLAGAQVFVKGDEMFVLPTFEHLDAGLLARSRENLVLVTVPAGALKAGLYRATLVGSHLSRAWTVQVH